MRRKFRLGLVVLGACILTACASAPASYQSGPQPAAEPARDLLIALRQITDEDVDSFEVHPLRDPAVDDLLERAGRAEQAGVWLEMDQALAAALDLVPGDPEIMQRRAEALLVQRELDQAETLAWESFQRGPQVGPLCRRNWATMRLAREERGDPDGAERASRQLKRCVVAPPVRM